MVICFSEFRKTKKKINFEFLKRQNFFFRAKDFFFLFRVSSTYRALSDDGNDKEGDGCYKCLLTPGWNCPAEGKPCVSTYLSSLSLLLLFSLLPPFSLPSPSLLPPFSLPSLLLPVLFFLSSFYPFPLLSLLLPLPCSHRLFLPSLSRSPLTCLQRSLPSAET
jgi:hypothetical protein